MTDEQLDLAGGSSPHGVDLTPRQRVALAFVREHGPVTSDELGAVLHELRLHNGGRGHDRDGRCAYCREEGADMGGVLRGKGLVERRRGPERLLVWVAAGSAVRSADSADRSAQLGADDPFPEGF